MYNLILSRKFRFLIAGCFNAGVSYLIYAAYCFIFGETLYQVALAISWFLSSFISFSVQKYWVFQTQGNWFKEYIKCFITWVFSYFINAGLLELCVKIIGLNIYIAQILSTGLTAIFTYIVFKYFAFKKS
ncbi:GtrA family protein [bacterium]|nr:GtrA family protein [bacterium]